MKSDVNNGVKSHLNALQQASDRVLQDLIDCLFVEDFFAGLNHQLVSLNTAENDIIWQWTVSDVPLVIVQVPVTAGITQAIRKTPGSSVYLITAEPGQTRQLDPISLMELIIETFSAQQIGNRKGAERLLATLKESIQQGAWSIAHNINTDDLLAKSSASLFQVLEQWGSLRDRPFHPAAKAKTGLNQQDYQAVMAEFGQVIALNWVAVDKNALLCGGELCSQEHTPAQFILSVQQQLALTEEMQHRGIADSHIALPVHPWQLQHGLPTLLPGAFETDTCQILAYQGGNFLSTSSVRSLAPDSDSEHYLKLPMNLYSLGSCRDLPARKMINGDRGEKLLRQAMGLDLTLKHTLYLGDESKWWAYLPEGGDIFDKPPRHLAAMVRTYPPQLLQNPDYRLLPMAALGTTLPDSKRHFFDDWLVYRQLPASGAAVITLFKELCSTFFEVNLRLYKMGMVSEIHGQNSVMVWYQGKMQGLLLRDHDSLRIYPPWLAQHGLMDPNYVTMPGKTSILYQQSPIELLFCLQTLGIQVNLRAIIEVLSDCYDIAESALWQALQQALSDTIQTIGFTPEVETLLQQQLFENKQWPLKLLLKPLIQQAAGAESMPFGQSVVQNPLYLTSTVMNSSKENS